MPPENPWVKTFPSSMVLNQKLSQLPVEGYIETVTLLIESIQGLLKTMDEKSENEECINLRLVLSMLREIENSLCFLKHSQSSITKETLLSEEIKELLSKTSDVKNLLLSEMYSTKISKFIRQIDNFNNVLASHFPEQKPLQESKILIKTDAEKKQNEELNKEIKEEKNEEINSYYSSNISLFSGKPESQPHFSSAEKAVLACSVLVGAVGLVTFPLLTLIAFSISMATLTLHTEPARPPSCS